LALSKKLDSTDGLGYDGSIRQKKGMQITINVKQIVGKLSRIVIAEAPTG
jgi:hypothetical protein